MRTPEPIRLSFFTTDAALPGIRIMSAAQPRLYALPDCTVQPIDAQGIMLIRVDTGAVALVDARWHQFLGELRVFRTLEDHAQVIAKRLPELQGHEKGLEEGLKQLIPRGILYSSDEVISQLERASDASFKRPPITLCIRTCDRPEFLNALLESLRDNARQFDTAWPVEILDDSKLPQSRTRNRQLADQFSDGLNIAYVGLDEQDILLDRLCREAPDDAEALRWLLDAKHPANRDKPTHGRLYNLAFIRHAGQRILLLDDDTLIKAWQLPRTKDLPRFQLMSLKGATLADKAQASEFLEPFAQDPIACHADYLGLPIADAIRKLTGASITPELIEDAAVDSIPHPYTRVGKVRYTHNGYIGDTGATTDHNRLFRLRLDLPPLLFDEQAYRRFLSTPRCVLSLSDQPELLNGTHFQHTTCAGFDLSELLPPVLPRGRSEDGLLMSLMRLLYPGDYGLRHPFALEHRLHDADPWIFAPDQLLQVIDQPTALGLWTNSLAAPAEVEPEARLNLLVESLLTAQSAGILRDRLAAILERETNQGLAFQFAVTRGELAEQSVQTPSGPKPIPPDSQWRQDMDESSRWLAEHLYHPAKLKPVYQMLDQSIEDISTFARAIPAWQRAYYKQMDVNRH